MWLVNQTQFHTDFMSSSIFRINLTFNCIRDWCSAYHWILLSSSKHKYPYHHYQFDGFIFLFLREVPIHSNQFLFVKGIVLSSWRTDFSHCNLSASFYVVLRIFMVGWNLNLCLWYFCLCILEKFSQNSKRLKWFRYPF